jgi:hypothetical protein
LDQDIQALEHRNVGTFFPNMEILTGKASYFTLWFTLTACSQNAPAMLLLRMQEYPAIDAL